MADIPSTVALQLAQAARRFQEQRTGHAPTAVTVVLSEGTLVITLHGALTPAEQALSRTPSGAAKVQEFHRQLFASSSAGLRREIKEITGVDVREAAAEVETNSGTVVHAFTSGTMVQVFLLAPPPASAHPNGGGQQGRSAPGTSGLAPGGQGARSGPQGPPEPTSAGGPP
jgi:uncharacterized protein YbcI